MIFGIFLDYHASKYLNMNLNYDEIILLAFENEYLEAFIITFATVWLYSSAQ